MLLKVAFLVLILAILSQSIPVKSEIPSNLNSYSFAVDLSVPATLSQLQCIKQAGYSAVFVRAYSPNGQGIFDTNSTATIQNAYRAGLGTEVYMTPEPFSSKTGSQQLDEVYRGLEASGISIRSVWIQVVNAYYWPTNPTSNIDFINSIVIRAKQYGMTVGIYTSANAWDEITSSYFKLSYDVLLWYTNVVQGGVNGETPANFDDFHGFGSWFKPSIKQFAQQEQICQLIVNRNVYTPSSGSNYAESSHIFVGGLFNKNK